MLYSQSEDNILQFCLKMSFHWVENVKLAIFSSHIDIINPLFSDFHFHCGAVSYQCNSHSYFNLSFVLFQLLLIKCCLCCWCSLHATMMCLDVYFLLAILLVIMFLKMHGLVFFISSEKFSAIISSNIVSFPIISPFYN